MWTWMSVCIRVRVYERCVCVCRMRVGGVSVLFVTVERGVGAPRRALWIFVFDHRFGCVCMCVSV